MKALLIFFLSFASEEFEDYIHLDGIVYYDENNWYIWINGKGISSKGRKSFGSFEIKKVFPEGIEIEVTTLQNKKKCYLAFNETLNLENLLI